jgi:hypothetical protein
MQCYAQGDVLLIQVADIEPASDQIVTTKDGVVVLAEGRVSGRPHIFPSGAVLFRSERPMLPPPATRLTSLLRRFLRRPQNSMAREVPRASYIGHVKIATSALLVHGRGQEGDRDPIRVPAGTYIALRQREYHAEEARRDRSLRENRWAVASEYLIAPRVSSDAQALIDRLRRFDPARPRLDRPAVENALARHLAARGISTPPIMWSPDLASGIQHVLDLVLAAIRRDASYGAAVEIASQIADTSSVAGAAALDATLDGTSGYTRDLAKRILFVSGWDDRDAVMHATREAGVDHDAVEAARQAANAAVQIAFAEASLVRSSIDARQAVEDAVLAAAGPASEDRIWRAAFYQIIDGPSASGGARQACMEVNALASFDHPAQRRLADIWLPMIDAFEAGLWFYWITPDGLVCVPRPRFHIGSGWSGSLHRPDGPAVEWESGTRYWFWRGVQVPQWLIEEPSRITPSLIRSEHNLDLRRCMIERFGVERFIRETVHRPAAEDRHGRLWRCTFGDDDPFSAVEVQDVIVGRDGTRPRNFLSVPARMRTAHEAVAWTYCLRREEYDISMRT